MELELGLGENILNMSEYKDEESTTATSIAMDIVFILLDAIGVSATIVLIYVILHFRRLHTVVNLFLVNRSIADIIRLIIDPGLFEFIISKKLEENLFCLTTQVGAFALIATLVFEIFMVFDWVMENFYPNSKERWRKHYKVMITAIWAPTIYGMLMGGIYCVLYISWSTWKIIGVLLFMLLILFSVGVHIARCILVYCRKSKTSNHCGLGLVTISIVIQLNEYVAYVTTNSVSVLLPFEFALPVIFIVYLYFYSRDFGKYLRKLVVCDLSDDVVEVGQRCHKCGTYVNSEDVSDITSIETAPVTS